ncbi:MAG TPA: hypothetical protein DCP92_20850 [Nitrospiraceae bacterium]|nr:hypothetical protein [Nitrospiraceae bacterium]
MTVLGPIGYFAGASLVYFDQGHVMKYPLHFVVGTLITFAIVTTFLISREKKSLDSPLRTYHFVLDMLIICLYVIQVFLGLQILF